MNNIFFYVCNFIKVSKHIESFVMDELSLSSEIEFLLLEKSKQNTHKITFSNKKRIIIHIQI